MKLLNGKELAGFIKERQAKQVRSLRQAQGISPKLAIIQCKDDPVIDTYIRLKQAYGADILIEVEVHRISQAQAEETITKLNSDRSIHGIIVQLPLPDIAQTDDITALVAPAKDVDALGPEASYEPATPMAIMWLLAGYNIDLRGKQILLIGKGKLVGAPLLKLFEAADFQVTVADRETKDLPSLSVLADVIITAAGSPAILYPDMIRRGAVVVDAGVASEDGKTVGDVALEVYKRDDITITPQKGGVGPLTVCALFENVIRAAQAIPAKE